MRRLHLSIVVLLSFACPVSGQTGIQALVAEADPAIQEQINRVYSLFVSPADAARKTKYEVLKELQQLKDITEDKSEIVKQLAIFVATAVSAEGEHIYAAGKMLEFLEVQPSVPIRVFAPYLDSENAQLRDFVRGWFHHHDSNERIHGEPPLGSVNYHEYMEYVRNRVNRNEEIPLGFIKFIYERHPGKALLVFAYADRHSDVVSRLLELHKAIESARQGRERTPEEIRQSREKKRQDELRLRQKKERLWEMLLAEHTVSNAIWLKENDLFPHRFEAAIPEAKSHLEALAKKEWWGRLYVVYIMRLHPDLRHESILKQLRDDRNDLVREAAQAAQ